MSVFDQIRHAGGLRHWLRWKLWERNLVRCPYCTRMTDPGEWEGICDCFVPHKWWIR